MCLFWFYHLSILFFIFLSEEKLNKSPFLHPKIAGASLHHFVTPLRYTTSPLIIVIPSSFRNLHPNVIESFASYRFWPFPFKPLKQFQSNFPLTQGWSTNGQLNVCPCSWLQAIYHQGSSPTGTCEWSSVHWPSLMLLSSLVSFSSVNIYTGKSGKIRFALFS